jgi:beta-lactam-binding protein with PASTA domain
VTCRARASPTKRSARGAGKVVSQNRRAGAQLKNGTKIALVVGRR